MSRRRLALGIGTILVMGLLLLVYGVFHTPLRKPVWDALWDTCTMFCRPPNLGSVVFDAVGAIWLIGAALAGAVPLAQRLVTGTLQRVAAWGLLAYGLLVIPSAIVAFVGDQVGMRLLLPPVGTLLASLPALVILGVSLRAGWRPHVPRGTSTVRVTPVLAVLAALAVASILIQVGFAMRYPVTGFDDMGYHAPLAVLFWQDGSITTFLDRFGGTPVLNHPGGAELWQGLLLLIGGEPLAIAGQVPFALLGAVGVTLFGRRLGLRTGAGVLAALFFLLAPMVTEQLGHLRNDVVGASLVIVTAALLAGGDRQSLPSRLILGCLGIGLMAVTKLALLPAIGALVLVVAWLVIRELRSGRDLRPVWKALGLGILLAGLAVAPWWLRNLLREGNPLYPLNLPLIGGGLAFPSPPDSRYVPAGLLWPLYPLLEEYGPADGLGGAFAVGILPGIIAAFFLARRRALGVLGLLVLVSLPAWVLLDRREPRFLLGIAGLCFALIPFALVALQRRWRTAAMALLVAASFVTVGGQWLVMSPDKAVERFAYYDKTWGIDPVADALPETEGILLDDRCGSNLGRLYPWFGAGQQRHLARLACDDATPEQVLKLLKREKLAYVSMLVLQQDRAARSALYPSDAFTIVHESTFQGADGTFDRVLYHWNDAPVRGADKDEDDVSTPPDDLTGG